MVVAARDADLLVHRRCDAATDAIVMGQSPERNLIVPLPNVTEEALGSAEQEVVRRAQVQVECLHRGSETLVSPHFGRLEQGKAFQVDHVDVNLLGDWGRLFVVNVGIDIFGPCSDINIEQLAIRARRIANDLSLLLM